MPSENKFYGLDHLRSLAIIMVFISHYFFLSGGGGVYISAGFAKFLGTGVDLFFVLSGFLISTQLFQDINQDKRISLKNFYLKRLFRIIPAYLVTLFVYYVFPTFQERNGLPELWKFLTFTHNFNLNYQRSGAFSHAWSLCVEEHFYLLFPLVVLSLQLSNELKKGAWLLLILFLGGFVARYYSYVALYFTYTGANPLWVDWLKYIYYPTYNRLDAILIGIAIAMVYNFALPTWQKLAKYGSALVLTGLIILGVAFFFHEQQYAFTASIINFPLVACGYGCLVIGAISPGCFLYTRKFPLTSFIATISYSLYLTHKGIIHLIYDVLALKVEPNLMFFLTATACALGAILLNKIVEQPFLRIRSKILKQS